MMRTRTFSKKLHSNLMPNCLSKSSLIPLPQGKFSWSLSGLSCNIPRGLLWLQEFMSWSSLSMPWRKWRHWSLSSLCCCLVCKSYPTLWEPMDYSPSGSYLYGILQARLLKWVAIAFSRGSSWPGDRTQVFWIVGRFFTIWATRESPGIKQWEKICS